MRSQVIVSWGDANRYTFDLEELQPMPQDLARAWLEQQFIDLGCQPLRLSGKLLLADQVIAVAHAVGESRFSEPDHRPWAQAYAQAVSAVLAKPMVHVDLTTLSVGY